MLAATRVCRNLGGITSPRMPPAYAPAYGFYQKKISRVLRVCSRMPLAYAPRVCPLQRGRRGRGPLLSCPARPCVCPAYALRMPGLLSCPVPPGPCVCSRVCPCVCLRVCPPAYASAYALCQPTRVRVCLRIARGRISINKIVYYYILFNYFYIFARGSLLG